MKKMFLLLMAGVVVTGALYAQGGGFQRKTVQERVKIVHDKLDSAFKLEPAKLANADSVFANFYREQDKVREDLMSGGQRPDFSQMREKMQPLMDSRDKELQGILTADQFKTWKDQIEPTMRPRRQGGGGGGDRSA